jgi:hypothetical protein
MEGREREEERAFCCGSGLGWGNIWHIEREIRGLKIRIGALNEG